MADKSLKRAYFLLFRNTGSDAGTSNPDPVGYCSCRMNVARFLDIDKLVATVDAYTKRKGYTRNKTLADGTVLGGEDTQVKESEVKLRRTVGPQQVILTTGRPTKEGSINKSILTFRFPAWATARTISEALGELIPETKISVTPGPTEIFPEFRLNDGGVYVIMNKAAATASSDAAVGISEQTVNQIISKLDDGKKVEGKKDN